jgi:hypothetical protein
VCPACGGTDIEDQDVDTGDGIAETAHVCRDCGEAWPLGCICDWDAPSAIPVPGNPLLKGGTVHAQNHQAH